MADCTRFKELDETMAILKSKMVSETSAPKLAATYARVIDGFISFCRQSAYSSLPPPEAVAHYYEHMTGAKPYGKPKTRHLLRLARLVFIIRDTIEGRLPSKKYIYGIREMPYIFADDIRNYEGWLNENSYARGTITTRIGRIKQFLFSIYDAGNQGLASLTPETFSAYIAGLSGKYSSIGKTNILYTIRNYFACPDIKSQLNFDSSPFLTNLHTNKHERLRSCYTPDEIKRVLNVVNRSNAKGKMHYLMMLLAGLYGLRSCDIRTLKIANIDWKRRLITINQHKTKRFLELPIIQETLLAMLDYLKNGRPKTTDPHIFIRQRSPYEPYSENNHFSSKISSYFEKAGVKTENKHSGLHSMRHSLATSLLAGGIQIHKIANVLGHASPQATTVYLWSDIDQLRNAALEVSPYGK